MRRMVRTQKSRRFARFEACFAEENLENFAETDAEVGRVYPGHSSCSKGILNTLVHKGFALSLALSVLLAPLAVAQGEATGGASREAVSGGATGGTVQDEAVQNETGQDEVSLTLAEAVDLGLAVDADVVSAGADLAAAERELARTEADPLALRLPRVRAAQGVAGAQEALEAARLAARSAVAGAYHDALEADDALSLAEQRQAIAETTLQAQRIRLEAGAATQLDVDRAENELASAQRGVADAQEARNLAYSDLASQIGASAEGLVLQETQGAVEVPALETVLARLSDNAQLRAAERAVELSRVSLEAVDNAFSPRADIEAAEDTLSNAQTQLNEVRRSLELAVRGSYNAVVAAQGRLESALADLATSEETLSAQGVRFEAGSISRLDFENARLERANTVADAAAARHSLAEALLGLEQTVQGSAAGP